MACAFLVSLLALLYVVYAGIPFVEGEWVTEHGKAEGFEIGTTREIAFAALQNTYKGRQAQVKVIWTIGTDLATDLAPHEHPLSRIVTYRSHGYYLESVDSVTKMPRPLALGEHWIVKLPGAWVNAIHVTFSKDRVTRIRHSRWVFERP